MLMSALSGTVDRASVAGGRRDFDLNRPGCGNFRPELDEGAHRRISRACGERLLELLFLLSVQGVARENVRAGGVAGSHGKLGKRRKKLEALSAARDYTVIRVPMQYVPGDGKAASGGTGGRWVRPHCRRAHQWGINTKPIEQQRWVNACLIGANRITDDDDIRRPEYHVV
jgi:hypothetical protein